MPSSDAEILGFGDLYYRGWLLATINLSDLAAAGATPLGLLTSLILPSELQVADFIRLLDGVDACCRANGTTVLGGNLKEGKQIDVQATAFGAVSGAALSRYGCQAGDLICIAGPAGAFWAGTLSQMGHVNLPDGVLEGLLETVLTPMPQLMFGRALQTAGLRAAVMDNSDGLGPSLGTIADINELGVVIDLTDIVLRTAIYTAAEVLDIDPCRFLFGWGDWNLVVVIEPDHYTELNSIASNMGIELLRIGEVTDDPARVLRRGGQEVQLSAPDSQRFAADSWFTVGIEEYIRQLRTFSMP